MKQEKQETGQGDDQGKQERWVTRGDKKESCKMERGGKDSKG
jgi:hypothetical protein